MTEDRGYGCFRFLIGRFRVEADPGAPKGRAMWLSSGDGDRVWPIWPVGFTAVYDPHLKILDANGRVVVEEGEWFDAGGSREDRTAYVCSINGTTYT